MPLFLTLFVAEPATLDTPKRDTTGVSSAASTPTRRPVLSRLSMALATSLRRLRLTSWDMADTRTQERDPLGELTRRLAVPPLVF